MFEIEDTEVLYERLFGKHYCLICMKWINKTCPFKEYVYELLRNKRRRKDAEIVGSKCQSFG